MDVEHILVPANGISSATNLGLRQVCTTFAAVTHDDCRMRTDWLHRVAMRLPDIGEAIVTGPVEPDGDGIVLTINTADEAATYWSPLIVRDPPNMAFAVRLLERVGWLEEHPSLATAGEDNEWAHRALRAGVAIVYDATVIVGHPTARKTSQVCTDAMREVRVRFMAGGCVAEIHSLSDARRAICSMPRGFFCGGSSRGIRSRLRWARGR